MPLSPEHGSAVGGIRRFELPAIAYDRIQGITGKLTYGGCMELASQVRRLDEKADSPMLFVLDSPGGSANGGDVLATTISFCRSPTIGLVVTRAASAGFTILQACDLRLALASSSLHTHFGYVSGSNETLTDATHVEAFAKWKEARLRLLRSHWERAVEAFSRRTGLAPEQARAILERDRLMPVHEAFAFRCLDGIV